MKLYTKSGDDGSTSLMYSRRVDKDHISVELLCSIDEIVAVCGVTRAAVPDQSINDDLIDIQEHCFRLGTFIATDPTDREKLDPNRSSIVQEDVSKIENKIDLLCETFEMPDAFVHPGQDLASAYADMARVTVRKCEFIANKAVKAGWIKKGEPSLIWLNRLSDYFFALARSLETKAKTREKH